MYKSDRNHQFTLSDFNQPVGVKMNPENRWVKKAAMIPWWDINELIYEYNTPDDPPSTGGSSDGDTSPEGEENQGTLILDATCAPQQISFPQDINLLNEGRENAESIIDDICYEHNYYKPRMYRQNARKDYLNLAKCKKKCSAKKIRKAIKKQLQYLRRDLGYIDDFMECEDIEFTEKQLQRIQLIREGYQQQEYMYLNNVHSVPNRIVSIRRR